MIHLLPISTEEREEDILWFFDLALLLKAANGALEILASLLVFVVPPSLIIRVVDFLTGGELAHDSNDLIATVLRSAAHSFAVHTHYFLALYLVIHGVMKVTLIIGIFAGKRIAYHLFMIALVFFSAYEAYRGIVRDEMLLQVAAIFDFILLILTVYEYRRRYPVRSSSRDTRGDYVGQ